MLSPVDSIVFISKSLTVTMRGVVQRHPLQGADVRREPSLRAWPQCQQNYGYGTNYTQHKHN